MLISKLLAKVVWIVDVCLLLIGEEAGSGGCHGCWCKGAVVRMVRGTFVVFFSFFVDV